MQIGLPEVGLGLLPGGGGIVRLVNLIGLERALRGACLDGPRSASIDDQGHLGAGARADLLVVPADLFEAPDDPDVLSGTRPLATLLDGEVCYRSPEFDR